MSSHTARTTGSATGTPARASADTTTIDVPDAAEKSARNGVRSKNAAVRSSETATMNSAAPRKPNPFCKISKRTSTSEETTNTSSE